VLQKSGSQLASVAKGSSDDVLMMSRAQVMSIVDDLGRAASACLHAEKVSRAAMEGFRHEAESLIDARDDIINLVNRFKKEDGSSSSHKRRSDQRERDRDYGR